MLFDEKVIFDLDSKNPDFRLFASDSVILTTHRFRYETKMVGYAQISSIMLEQLASIEVTQTTTPALLVFAIFFLLGTVVLAFAGSGIGAFVSLILFFFLLLLYQLSRREVLRVTASGITIRVNLRRVGDQFLERFIDEIEAAKNERLMKSKSVSGLPTSRQSSTHP